MTETERLLKAKIPCKETGIEIRKGICDICSPGNHCGLNAYVKDGKIIKIEGDEDHPRNRGLVCTKGMSQRQYIYREDRVLYPQRRVGKKGEGRFERISWDEAYREIAEKFNMFKEESGAESVAFFSGYTKWYRPYLRRLAFSFGSPNYCSESSTCFTSGWMAWKIATGVAAMPDMAHSDLLFAWAFNPYYSGHLNANSVVKLREKGLKIIIADPRITPATEKLADLHLRLRPGTDGALALAIANELIQNGWIAEEYIEKYVHGFDEFREYAKGFNASNVEGLTGVPYSQVQKAAQMIHESRSMCTNESSAPLGHHVNGLQNYRAIKALQIITGNYDAKGGQKPSPHTYTHVGAGFRTYEEEFFEEKMSPSFAKAVGQDRFPLWYYMEKEAQSNCLAEQILTAKPYPVRGIFACGMNMRMFPGDNRMTEALKKLEFFVDVDLFMSDTAKYADIVLPACTSLEREEFKVYGPGYVYYTKPVIEPLGESKPDTDIISDLANALGLDDEYLCGGYRKCVDYILKDNQFTRQQLMEEGKPIKAPDWKPYEFGSALKEGLSTPTGKIELKSELIASHPEWGLDALPTYREPEVRTNDYPFTIVSGPRIPNAIHSRLHDLSWTRSLRPDPLAEISLEDARHLGIKDGEKAWVVSKQGRQLFTVSATATVQPGEVYIYHGYREADANALTDPEALDPYCGFPAYNSGTCCRIEKEEK